MRGRFGAKWLNSRINSGDVQKSERILGYFVGPCLMHVVYHGVAGNYLTQFYTDVLGIAGAFWIMMPLLSKLLSSVISVWIGRWIEHTRTMQGKARPWLLFSGLLMAVCGVLLYAVPRASYQVQIAWVIVSYNLFFSLALSVYSLSHSLMLPLSTRNAEERDGLAMLTSTAVSIIPGALTTVLMPLLVRKIGVGGPAQGAWLSVMSALSAVAVPAALLEYYFTLERVTAEKQNAAKPALFGRQLSICLKERCWVLLMMFTIVLQLGNALSSASMLYYCNWVLGSSIESGAECQIMVNVIGQAPLGLGVLVLWPTVRRFGKRKVIIGGFMLASIGSLIVLLGRSSTPCVLIGLLAKATGSLPNYVMGALWAETIDRVEESCGFRADAVTASINSIVLAVTAGLGQTALLAGMNIFDYITPQSAAQVISQPQLVQDFFAWCFAGLPMLCYAACAVIMLRYHACAVRSQA